MDHTGDTPNCKNRSERDGNKPSNSACQKRNDFAAKKKWLRQRNYEDISNYVMHTEKDLFRGCWETRSERKNLFNLVKMEREKFESAEADELLNRRMRLKDLLEDDNQRLIEEEKIVPLSKEGKKAEMLERYTDIMVKKEAERQKFAKSMKEIQFRNNCDELRTIISKRICKLTAEEGKSLMADKAKAQNERKIEEKMYEEAWLEDGRAKMLKIAEEEALQKQRDLEFGEYIQGQMKSRSRNIEYPNPLSESQISEERNRLYELDRDWEKDQKSMKQEKCKKDLDSCLKDKLNRQANEVQEDLMKDLYFLEQGYDAELEKKAVEEKKKMLHKTQTEFLDFVHKQSKQKCEYEKKVEKMQQEASNAMWDRKEQEWESERKMKEAQDKKNMQACYEQIQNKILKSQEVQKMRMDYSREIKRQVETDLKQMEQDLLLVKEKNIKNREELQRQIAENKEEAQKLKDSKQQEWEKFKLAEEEYDQKVKSILAGNPKIDNLHPGRS